MTDADVDLTPLEELTGLLKTERRRWRAWFVIVGLAVGALGIVAVQATNAADDAQRGLDEVVAARTEARVVACRDDVRFADAHNALTESTAQVLRDASQGARSPEAVEFYARQIASLEANRVDVRDCSPEGIADYYEGDARP